MLPGSSPSSINELLIGIVSKIIEQKAVGFGGTLLVYHFNSVSILVVFANRLSVTPIVLPRRVVVSEYRYHLVESIVHLQNLQTRSTAIATFGAGWPAQPSRHTHCCGRRNDFGGLSHRWLPGRESILLIGRWCGVFGRMRASLVLGGGGHGIPPSKP